MAADAVGGLDVYFGLHPRRAARGSGVLGVGTNDDVMALAGIAVDVDLHGRGAKHASLAAALCVFEERLPGHLQPPLVMISGHGVWGLWPFAETLSISERAKYLELGRRLAGLLGSDPSIYDLRRIARVPGTRNWRDRAHPVRAQLLRCHEGACFALSDFEDWLPALPMEHKAKAAITRAGPGASAVLPPTTLPAPILRVLGMLGLPTRPVFDRKSGGLICVKILGECPVCRASDARAAWVTPSGHLKCWHHHCPAGSEATGTDARGHARGLALHAWVSAYAPLALPVLSRSAPEAAKSERCTDLAEATRRLAELVEEAIGWAEEVPGRVALLAANPGLGKTREVLRAFAERSGRGTLLAQSHARLDERERESEATGLTRRRRFHGLLSVVDDEGRPVCRFARALAPWAERGWSIRSSACGTCEHRTSYRGTGEMCSAFLGTSGKGTRFATHAHAATLGPSGELAGPIIADELPALLLTVALSAQELVPLTFAHVHPEISAWVSERAPLARIVVRVARSLLEERKAAARPGYAWRISGTRLREHLIAAAAAETDGGTLPLFEAEKIGAATLNDAVRRVVLAHATAPHPPAPNGPTLRAGRIVAQHYPHHAIDDVLIALARDGASVTEGGPVACLVADGRGESAEVRLEWRGLAFGGWRDKDGKPLSLVVLDASAPYIEHSIRGALPNREVRMFRLELQDPDSVERVYLSTQALSRRSLFASRYATGLRDRAGPAVARILRVVGRRLAASGCELLQLGIITHAPLGRILRDCMQALDGADPDARARVEDAGAGRVLGELAALREARRLGQVSVLWYGGQRGSNALEDCAALLCLGDPWPDVGAGLEEARALAVGGDLHIEGLVGAEVLQALGRARAVRRSPERPVVLFYAGAVPPACWAGVPFGVEPLGEGRARSEAALDAEDLARELVERWGAACPALVRVVAAAPGIIPRLDHRPETAIGEDPISSCRSVPPSLELEWTARVSREMLRAAFERALGELPLVSVPSPTSPGGCGRDWRMREAVPGAARAIAEIVRDFLRAEGILRAPAGPVAKRPAGAAEPALPPSRRHASHPSTIATRCTSRESRRAHYCARRARSARWVEPEATGAARVPPRAAPQRPRHRSAPRAPRAWRRPGR